MTTEIEGEVRDMCNLSAGVREETLLSSARSVMDRLGALTAEAALELVGATKEERVALAPQLVWASAAAEGPVQ